jgi:MYXO-CTERM domain-containing protein
VEVSSDATYSVHDDVRYEVRADGTTHEIRIDPRGGGWHALGEYTFAAGGEQWVAVFDDESTSPGSDQHIVADAVRLTRIGPDEDTGQPDSGGTDTAPTDTATGDSGQAQPDSAAPDSASLDTGRALAPGDVIPMNGGCGCAAAAGARGAWALLGLTALVGARRRRSA